MLVYSVFSQVTHCNGKSRASLCAVCLCVCVYVTSFRVSFKFLFPFIFLHIVLVFFAFLFVINTFLIVRIFVILSRELGGQAQKHNILHLVQFFMITYNCISNIFANWIEIISKCFLLCLKHTELFLWTSFCRLGNDWFLVFFFGKLRVGMTVVV